VNRVCSAQCSKRREPAACNVRLYVTSTAGIFVPRQDEASRIDPINSARPRSMEPAPLYDRFGLRLGFHAAYAVIYLAIIARYAEAHVSNSSAEDALAMGGKQRGSRSGRVAWQYIVELPARRKLSRLRLLLCRFAIKALAAPFAETANDSRRHRRRTASAPVWSNVTIDRAATCPVSRYRQIPLRSSPACLRFAAQLKLT